MASGSSLGDKIRSYAAGYAGMADRKEYADGMLHAADIADAEGMPSGMPMTANAVMSDKCLAQALLAACGAFMAALEDGRAPPRAPAAPARLVPARRRKKVPAILDTPPAAPGTPPAAPGTPPAAPSAPPAPIRDAANSNGLNRCERAILTVLVQRNGKSTTERQLAVLTGYRRSGNFFAAIRAVKTAGLAEGKAHSLSVTPLGLETLPDEELPAPGEELVRYWMAKLPKTESVLLGQFVDHYPKYLFVDELASRSGYQVSGSFLAALRTLRTIELVERHPTDRRLERASPDLVGMAGAR